MNKLLSKEKETCPYCGSKDLDYGSIEIGDEANDVYYPVECRECESNFLEYYYLSFDGIYGEEKRNQVVDIYVDVVQEALLEASKEVAVKLEKKLSGRLIQVVNSTTKVDTIFRVDHISFVSEDCSAVLLTDSNAIDHEIILSDTKITILN